MHETLRRNRLPGPIIPDGLQNDELRMDERTNKFCGNDNFRRIPRDGFCPTEECFRPKSLRFPAGTPLFLRLQDKTPFSLSLSSKVSSGEKRFPAPVCIPACFRIPRAFYQQTSRGFVRILEIRWFTTSIKKSTKNRRRFTARTPLQKKRWKSATTP